jgi:hypothetical protein
MPSPCQSKNCFAERLFGEWTAVLAANEGKVAARAGSPSVGRMGMVPVRPYIAAELAGGAYVIPNMIAKFSLVPVRYSTPFSAKSKMS